jgi:hypothetical protein
MLEYIGSPQRIFWDDQPIFCLYRNYFGEMVNRHGNARRGKEKENSPILFHSPWFVWNYFFVSSF